MVKEKQKLTLSVDKELVEKAKKLGVNISEITEKVLKHISETKTKDVVIREELNEAYKKLFDAMLPAMKKFGTSVPIGRIDLKYYKNGKEITVPDDLYLLRNGNIGAEMIEEVKFSDLVEEPNYFFDSPKEILSNYIDSLIKASEKNKEKLKELEIFRRVVEALTETTAPEYRKEKK